MDCIAFCNLYDENTPVGLLLDEAKNKALAVCNDKLYCFDLTEITQPDTLLSKQEARKITYHNCIHLGGNARSVCKGKQTHGPPDSESEFLFALSCRNYPIKIYNADGELKTSVLMKNDYDEIDEIYSIEFVCPKETSSLMLGGGKNRIYTYDFHHEQALDCIKLNSKGLFSTEPLKRQKGIVSCLSLKTAGTGSLSVFASGSFSGTVFLHDLNDRNSQVQLHDTSLELKGVTELYWLGDLHRPQFLDYHVISGHRNSNSIYVWDVRRPNKVLLELVRENSGSNQRFNINLQHGENRLKLTFGDSKGNLNIQKLKLNHQDGNQLFHCPNDGQRIQLESRCHSSIPFVEAIHKQELVLTLSGERSSSQHTQHGARQGCAFKIWKTNTMTPSKTRAPPVPHLLV